MSAPRESGPLWLSVGTPLGLVILTALAAVFWSEIQAALAWVLP